MNRRSLAAAAAAVFAAFAGMFGAFPILTPYTMELGGTAEAAALAVSVYSITNLPGNLVAGVLIGPWGPLAVLRLGLVLVTASVFLYTVTGSVPALIAYRAVHGFAAGWIVPAAFALAADWLPEERRGRGMGQMGAPIGLSAVLLPPITGIIGSRLGPRAAFGVLTGIIALIATLVEVGRRLGARGDAPGYAGQAAAAAAGAVGDGSTAAEAGDGGGRAGRLAALWGLITDRRMLPVWLGGFVLPFNLGLLSWYLPVAAEGLALGGSAAGGAGLGILAGVAAAVMLGPGGRWTDRPSLRPRLALLGIALIGAAMALWLGPGAASFYGAAVVFGFGFGLVFPAANALIAALTTEETRGLGFALFYAWYSVATAVGPPLLAWWHEVSGQPPFGAGAAVSLLLAMVGLVVGRPRGGMR
ncbi:MAG TPA: MFS transporter [Bacillota bacterium]